MSEDFWGGTPSSEKRDEPAIGGNPFDGPKDMGHMDAESLYTEAEAKAAAEQRYFADQTAQRMVMEGKSPEEIEAMLRMSYMALSAKEVSNIVDQQLNSQAKEREEQERKAAEEKEEEMRRIQGAMGMLIGGATALGGAGAVASAAGMQNRNDPERNSFLDSLAAMTPMGMMLNPSQEEAVADRGNILLGNTMAMEQYNGPLTGYGGVTPMATPSMGIRQQGQFLS
jgi:hypothetical protein